MVLKLSSFCIISANGTDRARVRVEDNRQSLKGFADNIEERRKRENYENI